MDSKDRVLRISEADLDELIDYMGKVLVGKALKRFEIHQDTNAIKREVKELVYENYRQLRDLMIAHSAGLGITQFRFIPRPNPTTKDS